MFKFGLIVRSWPKSDIARHRGDVANGHAISSWALPVDDSAPLSLSQSADFSFTSLSRSALAITLTEESDIAAAAMIGDSSRPVKG